MDNESLVKAKSLEFDRIYSQHMIDHAFKPLTVGIRAVIRIRVEHEAIQGIP